MTTVCAQCNTTNSAKSRFCRSCGAAIAIVETDPAATIPLADTSAPPVTTQPLESAASISPPSPEPPPLQVTATSLLPEAPSSSEITQQAPELQMPAALAAEIQSELARAGAIAPNLNPVNDDDVPIRLACNFNRVFIQDCSTTFQIRVENTSPFPLDAVTFHIECGGWKEPVLGRTPRLAPGKGHITTLSANATNRGSVLLNCTLKAVFGEQERSFRGTTTATIIAQPDAHNMVFNIVNQVENKQTGSNAGLGGDPRLGGINIGSIMDKNVVRDINDLIQLTLPPNFVDVELALDYEQSLRDIVEFESQDAGMLHIPKPFLAQVQEGALLKLSPAAFTEGGTLRPLVISSRRQFKFGVKSDAVDFLTWFMPRSEDNDLKTKRISRWHCSLEWRDDGLWIVDNNSPNHTTFDREQVLHTTPVTFARRGLLGLAGTYYIDMIPFESENPQGPRIVNLSAWKGPAAGKIPPPAGCVRLDPKSSDPAKRDSVWLLADGKFGVSRSNPIVLDVPGLAETQGRLHYWRGCYWLENTMDNGAVRIMGHTLKSNQIVPLTNGQTVELGSPRTPFRVEILA